MLVVDPLVDYRVKGRDQPAPGAHARDDVDEREPLILQGAEARRRRLKIVQPSMARLAPPRLNELHMHEQPLQRRGEVSCHLEFGRAPGHVEIVSEQYRAAAIDEHMRNLDFVRAGVAAEIVDRRIVIDIRRKIAASIVRRARVVHDEIGRRRCERVVVAGVRHRVGKP